MILSKTKNSAKNITELLPMQKEDFISIYKSHEGSAGNRPSAGSALHEFLPTEPEDIEALAKDMDMSMDEMMSTIHGLEEFNPMLGHRGCRLAVTFPEIAVMQTRAIMEAAIEVKKEDGYNIVPEIMIPLIGMKEELDYVENVVRETAERSKAKGLRH